MSPDALRYYKMWLERRFKPFRLYALLCSLMALFFLFLTIYFRLRVGDWSLTGTVGFSTAFTILPGVLLIFAIRGGALVGGWALLENLESGYRSGHYREVWHALMIKYRGLHPDIVAGERFHRLFVAVGSDIVAHEDLTLEQKRWMDDLLSTARANLGRCGGVTVSYSKARYAKPLVIACLIFSVLSAAIKVVEMISQR